MAFIQRIKGDGLIDCITTEPVTDAETGHVIHPAGTVVWESRLHSDIHPEHRLNPGHAAEDHRDGEPKPVTVTGWCDDCKAHPAAAFIFA